MSFLDERQWGDPDEFSERFGDDAPSLEQIRALQVRPALLPLLRGAPGRGPLRRASGLPQPSPSTPQARPPAPARPARLAHVRPARVAPRRTLATPTTPAPRPP